MCVHTTWNGSAVPAMLCVQICMCSVKSHMLAACANKPVWEFHTLCGTWYLLQQTYAAAVCDESHG